MFDTHGALYLIYEAAPSPKCLKQMITSMCRNAVNILHPAHNVISSPEHEVLMVSYCGQSMSVVRRASCVVRRAASTIALKSLLLLHPWAN